MMLERFRPWIVFGLGAFIAGKAAWWYAVLVIRMQSSYSGWPGIAVEILAFFVIPALGGWAALWLDRRPKIPQTRSPLHQLLRKALAWTVAFGYLVTWIFGVPGVITRLTNEEARRYKETEASHHDHFLQESPPQFSTYVALPLIPGIIVLYRETYIDGQNGWGGWELYAWWGNGSTHLGTGLRSIS